MRTPNVQDLDALDRFVSECLAVGNVWETARISDGVTPIDRVFDRGPDAIGIAAQIYEVDDQSLHPFWLEVEWVAADHVRWRLYFDPLDSSERRAANACLNHEDPEEIQWFAYLSGDATFSEATTVRVESRYVAV